MSMQEAAMAQEQTKRGGGGADDDDLPASTAAGQERREKLTDETDDLLDEIDDVLEENAEDFVRAYVQKDGQCPGRFAIAWPLTQHFPEPLLAVFPHSPIFCAARPLICCPWASVTRSPACSVLSCRTERPSSR